MQQIKFKSLKQICCSVSAFCCYFTLCFEPFTLWIWPSPKHESCSPVCLVSLCKISAQTELPFARYEFFSNRTSTRKICLLSSTLDPVLTTLTFELNFGQNTKVVDLWIRFPSVYRTPQLDFPFESYDFSSDRTLRWRKVTFFKNHWIKSGLYLNAV